MIHLSSPCVSDSSSRPPDVRLAPQSFEPVTNASGHTPVPAIHVFAPPKESKARYPAGGGARRAKGALAPCTLQILAGGGSDFVLALF
jgi:hypothetical protein